MTSRTLITLPYPPRKLSPNSRAGWRVKAAVAAMYRIQCGWVAKDVWGTRAPLEPPLKMAVTFVVKDSRRRDLDNLIASFKSGQDGLVDAGVFTDDYGIETTYKIVRGDSFKVVVTV